MSLVEHFEKGKSPTASHNQVVWEYFENLTSDLRKQSRLSLPLTAFSTCSLVALNQVMKYSKP